MMSERTVWSGKDAALVVALAMAGFMCIYFALSFFVPAFSDRASFIFFMMPSMIFHVLATILIILLFKAYKIPLVEGLGRVSWAKITGCVLSGAVLYGSIRWGHDAFGVQVYDVAVRKLFLVPENIFIYLTYSLTLGPAIEEIVWRGFVYPSIASKVRVLLAVIFSALLNVVLVTSSGLTGAWALIFSLIPAVFFTIIRAHTRSTFAAIATHWGYNAASALVFFIRLVANSK